MARKKIRELDTGSITSNNDYFAVATVVSNEEVTVKVPYSVLVTALLHTSLEAGSNITITDTTVQDGLKKYTIASTAGGSEWYFGDTQPVSANENDYWLRTDTGHYGDVDQYDGTTWTNVGTFAGRDGQDGQDGITPSIDSSTKHWMIGSTDTGVVAEGQDGNDGSAATVDVGTVTTGAPGTQASITNSGTTSAAVFDFTIPRGADGTNGTNGTDGDDGASISASAVAITGGHRLTISSTDPQVSDVTFDVMDGTEIIQTSSDDRTVTLTVAGWTGASAPYTQTITVLGMTSSIVPIIAPSYSDTVATALDQQTEWGKITKAVSDTDSIVFKCYEDKPTVELTAIIKAV